MAMRLLKSGRVPKCELNKVWEDVKQAEVATLQAAKPYINDVLRFCVGTRYYSLKQLAQMGHPYANGTPGGLHAGVINVQSGEFFRGFRLVGPEVSKSKAVLYVTNQSWKATPLLSGFGGKMVARPWDTYLMWHLQRALMPKLGAMFASRLKLRQLD